MSLRLLGNLHGPKQLEQGLGVNTYIYPSPYREDSGGFAGFRLEGSGLAVLKRIATPSEHSCCDFPMCLRWVRPVQDV